MQQYDYDILLDKLYDGLTKNDEVIKLKTPIITYQPKKTICNNFSVICSAINRSTEHVMSFITTDFGCTGSINGNGGLILVGKYKQQSIECIIKKYIHNYVICSVCKSMQTEFKKEDRINYLVCTKCHSERKMQTIKEGFKATTRGDRKQKN